MVSEGSGVLLRAEDRRPVHSADCSPFLHALPVRCALDPSDVSSSNASGSLSMAAALAEAVEVLTHTPLTHTRSAGRILTALLTTP